jgi:hypothetical protein
MTEKIYVTVFSLTWKGTLFLALKGNNSPKTIQKHIILESTRKMCKWSISLWLTYRVKPDKMYWRESEHVALYIQAQIIWIIH